MDGVTQYRRTCTRCRRSMPMKGAITFPRFVCAECRKPPPDEPPPAMKKAA